MKRGFIYAALLITIAVTTVCCKKKIDELKANAVIDVMVKGKWAVREYLEDTTDITGVFTDYRFQFFRDNSVIAFLRGDTLQKGTWSGSTSTPVITINYNTATNPLLGKLNGTWTAYTYDSNGPKFTQTINGVIVKLSLR